MYQLSYYTIFSDSVNSKGDFVLFSTRTGQATVLSKSVRDKLETGELENIPRPIFDKLLNDKVLVPIDEVELNTIVEENKTYIEESSDSLYEVIQPSAMCQLGCDYCGQDHQKKYFKTELFDKLIQRLRLKLSAKSYKSLYIGWFGGEPLMALPQIRSLTPQLKELAAEFGIPYNSKVVTNGLSLKENIFVELVNDLKVNSIEVTLDGSAEFHDQRRHTKEGGPSFDLIFKNLLAIFNREDFEQMGCRISIRCNVDGRNWDGVSPLIKLLADHGLQKKIAYFYPIGVYSWGGNTAHQKSLTKEEFAEKEIDWLIEMIEAGFSPSLFPGRTKKICIAVSKSSEMYDPYGNIYNCTEVSLTDFYQKTPYVLGNLNLDHKHINKERPLADWNDTLLTDTFPCHTCKMLPVCGGGCPKAWHEDMRACPSPKFNIKERLALAYVVSKTEMKDLATENKI
jgi:uncharacterized protein